jgi:hypothetical protein
MILNNSFQLISHQSLNCNRNVQHQYLHNVDQSLFHKMPVEIQRSLRYQLDKWIQQPAVDLEQYQLIPLNIQWSSVTVFHRAYSYTIAC